MSSFASLKQNRNATIANLTAELEKTQQQTTNYVDDRYWKPERDKSGNGYAVVRFLPQTEGEDLPWVRIWNHGFQGPGGWYIENSLTTLNQKDPVSEFNTSLWNNGTEAGKEQARKQKRRLNYVSNILVIKDPANPDNEGKHFLYRYGKRIFDKINDAMNPEFQDETPLNPFDYWEGADFKLKIRTVDGFVNYDRSEFDSTSAILDGDDAKLEELYNKQYSLQELVAPDQFKTFDELKAKMERVLGFEAGTDRGKCEEVEDTAPTPEPEISIESTYETSEGEGEEDTLSYFQKLAEGE